MCVARNLFKHSFHPSYGCEIVWAGFARPGVGSMVSSRWFAFVVVVVVVIVVVVVVLLVVLVLLLVLKLVSFSLFCGFFFGNRSHVKLALARCLIVVRCRPCWLPSAAHRRACRAVLCAAGVGGEDASASGGNESRNCG